ncbi:hypothetical protein ABPG72_014142 [Tetrahymena utriculariae]
MDQEQNIEVITIKTPSEQNFSCPEFSIRQQARKQTILSKSDMLFKHFGVFGPWNLFHKKLICLEIGYQWQFKITFALKHVKKSHLRFIKHQFEQV